MKMNWTLAAAAGLLGAVVMTLLLWLARLAGLTDMDLAMALGSIFVQDLTPAAWTLGFVIHLVFGVMLATIYGEIFEAWGGANWRRGVIISIPHTVVAGFVMWAMPLIHPLVPSEIPAPGYLAVNYGAVTAAAFVLLHLIFGAIVGGLYEVRPEHALPRRPSPPVHA